jgi:hypothetical protein
MGRTTPLGPTTRCTGVGRARRGRRAARAGPRLRGWRPRRRGGAAEPGKTSQRGCGRRGARAAPGGPHWHVHGSLAGAPRPPGRSGAWPRLRVSSPPAVPSRAKTAGRRLRERAPLRRCRGLRRRSRLRADEKARHAAASWRRAVPLATCTGVERARRDRRAARAHLAPDALRRALDARMHSFEDGSPT